MWDLISSILFVGACESVYVILCPFRTLCIVSTCTCMCVCVYLCGCVCVRVCVCVSMLVGTFEKHLVLFIYSLYVPVCVRGFCSWSLPFSYMYVRVCAHVYTAIPKKVGSQKSINCGVQPAHIIRYCKH